MPKLSVVVPVYGVEKYIERCARSLFSQTLDDIQYIFVNDCTCDNSISLLYDLIENEYANLRDSIVIVNKEINEGQSLARKTGLLYATGEYVIFCDSDDWLDVDAYKKVYNYAVLNNNDLVFFNYYISDGVESKISNRSVNTSSSFSIISSLLSNDLMGNLWSVLFKRDLFMNAIVFPTQNMIEDLALLVQLVYYSSSISFFNEPLYYYYFNYDSTSRSFSLQKCLDRIDKMKDNISIIQNFLTREHLANVFSKELVILKFSTRMQIEMFLDDSSCLQVWSNLYPEVESHLSLFSNYPLKIKVHYYLVKLRLYWLLKKLKH